MLVYFFDGYMMAGTWYHLSTDGSLQRVLASSAGRMPSSITPRIPDDSYGEDKSVRRVCIASTIWQCVLSIPRTGKLFIYRLSAESVTDPIGGTADIEVTNEKWITDEDLRRVGGEIRLVRIGFVNKTKELDVSLKIQNRMQNLPRDAAKEEDVWIVRKGEYILRPELVLR